MTGDAVKGMQSTSKDDTDKAASQRQKAVCVCIESGGVDKEVHAGMHTTLCGGEGECGVWFQAVPTWSWITRQAPAYPSGKWWETTTNVWTH